MALFSRLAVSLCERPSGYRTHRAAGSHGTRLWNIADMSEIPRASPLSGRGATLVVIWARQAEEAHDVLYAGTQNGYFYCWRQKDGVRMKDAFNPIHPR